MRFAVEQALLRSWTHRGWIACLLWPIALCMHALVMLRRALYRWNVLKVERVSARVIVVGNVVAGGAGKTPTVINIVQHLQARDIQTGVVSRGYAARHTDCQEVVAQSTPDAVGDEPLLIHQTTGVPVFVGKSRVAAARALLSRHPQTQVIVCDDGLQHYRLYRDLEVCVFDNRGCGNGLLLPAGPLREPWPRTSLPCAGQNDQRLLVLHTGNQPAFKGFTAQRSLSAHAIQRDGTRIAVASLVHHSEKPLMAIAGIAHPESFFSMLRALGLPLMHTLALPDHYHFENIGAQINPFFQIICTEKDAAKLWKFVPEALAVPLLQTAQADFFSALDTALNNLSATNLSSPHGHPTT